MSPADALSEPPAIDSTLYTKEAPLVVPPPVFPPRPSPTDLNVRRAEEHFQAGKRLYQEGELEGARREFDRAIDTLLATPEGAGDRQKAEQKLDELTTLIYRYDVDGFGSGDTDQPGFDKTPLEDILELTFPVDPKLKGLVKEQVAATVSQLPLQVNDEVLSYINFFSGERGRRTLISGLKRAGRYSAMISRVLSEEGVPQELIFLAQAESGFLPRAVSRAAATGMWQFIASRGREYGLMQNGYGDDRMDPERATRAAARHLKDLYTEFGDWYLAMAAYNCGPGNVERAVERTGYADFWELRARHVLPRETTNYVPIILAMTIMAKNPRAYQLGDIEPERPLEYDVLPAKSTTGLKLVADVVDSPVAELRELNPSLLADIVPPGYDLRVPKGTGAQALAALERVPEMHRATWRAHRVAPGDTLASIAQRYRTPAKSISAENPAATSLEAGEWLLVPVAYAEPRVARTVRGKRAGQRWARAHAARGSRAGGATALARSSSSRSKAGYTAASTRTAVSTRTAASTRTASARTASAQYAAAARKTSGRSAAPVRRRAQAGQVKVAGLAGGAR